MKILFLFIYFTSFHIYYLSSQIINTDSTSSKYQLIEGSDDIYANAEQMPTFPGGDKAWFKFLSKNMVYPPFAMEQDIQGKVWITFVIDNEGNVKDVTVARGIGGGCDEEAVRVVSMSPKWNPAILDGKPVSVKYNFPVIFTLK